MTGRFIRLISGFIATLAVFAGTLQTANADGLPFDTMAPNAILMDYDTGETLWAKDPDARIQPASMTKVMTVYLVFDAIKKGKLRLDEKLRNSAANWKKYNNTGSTMFIGVGDEVTVEDLLHGIIVLSGNDACGMVAEGLAGSEDLFVDWMNAKAKQLGMKSTHFVNSNGLDDPDHYSTVRDLATLARATIKDFPDLYPFYSMETFQYKSFTGNTMNRNPLVGRFPGADGLKTGGLPDQRLFGMIGSAARDGRRVIMAFMGAPTHGAREEEALKLMNYGMRNYTAYKLFDAGQTVAEAPVWLGQKDKVALVGAKKIQVVLDRAARENMKVKVAYDGPIAAPIKKGQPLGTLTVDAPGRKTQTIPLVAAEDVEESHGFGRIGAALGYLFGGN